jgi:hypothetical protein
VGNFLTEKIGAVGTALKDVLNPVPAFKKGKELLDKYTGSLDRSQRAEELYGGVGDLGVKKFGSQYSNYGGLADRYGHQGSGLVGQQLGLGQMLTQEAQGRGVGQQLVGMQARQAANRASAQQYGAVAGARPGMQAMASRNAMLGSALAQSAVGEQAAMGSAQMTLGAQQQLGGHLAGMRGQDQQQQLQNNQAQLQAYQQRLQLAQMDQQGRLTAEQLRAQRYAALMGAPTSGEIATGAVVGALGAIPKGGKPG